MYRKQPTKQHHIEKHGLIFLTHMLFAMVILAGCSSQNNANVPPPTPTTAPITFTTLDLGLPQKALDAPVVGTVPGDQMLHIDVALKIDQQALSQLGASNSQSGQATGTPDLAQKIGISDEKLKQLQAYFGIAHINVKPKKTHTSLTFDARTDTVATLLQTNFVLHQLNGRKYFTPDAAHLPKIPTTIAPLILAVVGLDNYSPPPTFRGSLQAHVLGTKKHLQQQNSNCLNFYSYVATPAKVAQAYGYNRLWNAGWHGEQMTVNLVEMDGFDTNDLGSYFSCMGSNAKLDYVNMGATAPAPDIEATLDIEMLAGLAPNIHMIDYQMDPALINGTGADWWTGFNNALQQIIDNNQNIPHPGSVVSISLGGAEDDLTRSVLLSVDQNLRILTNAEHMTVFISSGDCGAYSSGIYKSTPDTSFPASDPWAVAVGGTRLTFAGNGAETNETVWQQSLSNLSTCDNKWGSGGGVSGFFQKSTFQQGAGVANQYSTGRRQVPDISAVATNLPIFYQGQWELAYGTSAATPIWAAGMSLVNEGLLLKKRVYFAGPNTFYYLANHAGNAHPYNDITSGNNLYYQAGPAWDYTSGLGSPRLADIYTILYNTAA